MDVMCGTTNRMAAMPAAAPTRHPEIRRASFSTESPTVPSETM